MSGPTTEKTCESCGSKYKFRYWDGKTRLYRCRYCNAAIGPQETLSQQAQAMRLREQRKP